MCVEIYQQTIKNQIDRPGMEFQGKKGVLINAPNGQTETKKGNGCCS